VFHTDAVQIAGKLPISVKDLPVDMLSISGHKLHAPKGIGALYVQRGTKVTPHIMGGHQERGRRAGTENVPYIVGLGKACELAMQRMEQDVAHEAQLRDRLEAGILATCKGARVNGDTANRLPNTTNISFEFVEGEAILLMLDDQGVCASTGSACASGSLEPSHVLRAMDVPRSSLHGSIRLSLSRYNTDEDVDMVLEKLPVIINRLRELSPFAND
uniref:aminotransferase class V-fold PLP-dependent enzyme n=1 Tax=Pontiella sp. TaxID=2837462 RepID=UPI003564985E